LLFLLSQKRPPPTHWEPYEATAFDNKQGVIGHQILDKNNLWS
jgi:hypothetical protein